MFLHVARAVFVAGLLAAILIAPRPAAAQGTPDELEARTLFDAGELAYSRGNYDRAYTHFHQAHELSARPELLYNMGLAADRARMDAEAIAAYAAFVAALPDHPQRAIAETRLAALRRSSGERPAADSDLTPEPVIDPALPAEPDPAAPRGPGAGPWILIASGAGILAIGGVVLALGFTEDARVQGAPAGSSWSEYRDAYDRVDTLQIAGGIGIAAGALLLGAGIVWLVSHVEDGPTASLDRGRLVWRF